MNRRKVMVILLYLVAILWVISLFQFARQRVTSSGKQTDTLWLHKDWIFLLYMRISGIFIFIIILAIVNTR
jgi:TRAP-type C4-dicarboxylate transport system permease small subunit